jgi:hypothetical protein
VAGERARRGDHGLLHARPRACVRPRRPRAPAP